MLLITATTHHGPTASISATGLEATVPAANERAQLPVGGHRHVIWLLRRPWRRAVYLPTIATAVNGPRRLQV